MTLYIKTEDGSAEHGNIAVGGGGVFPKSPRSRQQFSGHSRISPLQKGEHFTVDHRLCEARRKRGVLCRLLLNFQKGLLCS